MSGLVTIPLPTVIWDFDVHWPSSQSALGVASAWDVSAEFASGGIMTTLWSALHGGGSSQLSLMGNLNALCGQLTSSAVTQAQRTLLGFSAYVPLSVGNLPAGFSYPLQARIWRFQFVVQLLAGITPGLACNVIFAPAAGVEPGPFSSNNPGAGIAGSVVTPGTWRYIGRRVSAAALAESVELGISQAVPTLFDFCLVGATALAPASFQLFINGQYGNPAIARQFVAGGLLPFYGDPINSARFTPQVEQSDSVNFGTLQIGYVRCMMGHFTPAGAAI